MREAAELSALVNLHALVSPTRANGPGLRATIFVQGCSLGCPGCHNPRTWSPLPRRIIEVRALVEWVRAQPDLRGVTLSGGEPFEQAYALAVACRTFRRHGLDVIAYSGFTREEIEAGVRPYSRELLEESDVLIDGRYEEAGRGAPSMRALPMRGSANQRIFFRTERIRAEELESPPRVEWIGSEGGARITGFGIHGLDPLVRVAVAARSDGE